MNNRTQEFRDRLFALCREFNVEMEIVEESYHWGTVAEGVNFFAYTQYDDDNNIVHDCVDLTLGTNEDFKE